MEIKKLTSNKGKILEGPLLIKPKIYIDKRGIFFESWNQSTFDSYLGEKTIFSQDNHSVSELGVLRGLHYQIPPITQGKLVRCVSGEIFDVAVDIRENSPTFGEWISANLNNENKLMLWIPSGYAHGFLSLKEKSAVIYKANGRYSKEYERSIKWDDKSINIRWPLEIINFIEPILSQKDADSPLLNQAEIFN